MNYATEDVVFFNYMVIAYKAIARRWLREASDKAGLNFTTRERKGNECNAIRATDATILTSMWQIGT
jgi:hypothetical protein